MAILFGVEWEETYESITGIDSIIVYSQIEIGRICFTTNALRFHWDEQYNYQILSLIYEKTINEVPYLICLEDEKLRAKNWNRGNNLLRTIEEVLFDFPKNFIEIQQRTLMNFYLNYPKYGQTISDISEYQAFANDNEDLIFILTALENKGMISFDITKLMGGDFVLNSPIVIQENGWLEIEKTMGEKASKQVFIAMWFDPTMDLAYSAIEKAVTQLGFSVMRIDRKQHNNEISGEILYEIKKSSVIIADVTNQRNGVYFEAGFALGMQKTVVWCCKESDIGNVHFDTRQYNHVLWKDEGDLYKKIKDRVLATTIIK